MSTMSPPQLPLSYRNELAGYILRRAQRGESCALVGMASVGKSNLVRFLQREDVRTRHLGQDGAHLAVLAIDGNGLAADGPMAWRVLELLAQRLMATLDAVVGPAAGSVAFADDYAAVVREQQPQMALGLCDRLLTQVIDQGGLGVAALFDEFDDIATAGGDVLFRYMRYLRDEHKYRVAYVTFTRVDPGEWRGRPADMEQLLDLVGHSIRGLSPYSPEDAANMVERLADRMEVSISRDKMDRLVRRSGGHAGILRALFWHQIEPSDRPEEPEHQDPRVWSECRTVWLGLSEDERDALQQLARGIAALDDDDPAIRLLRLKGAITSGPNGDDALFSPVFAAFAAESAYSAESGLVADSRTGQVRVDGRPVVLAPIERKLVFKLAEEPGRLFKTGELMAHLYPDEKWDPLDKTDGRLHVIASRARKATEAQRSRRRFILTVRGEGLRLDPAGASHDRSDE